MAASSHSDALRIAHKAIHALGCGYDVTQELWLKYCKPDGPLLQFDPHAPTQDLHLPGNISLSSVPACIKFDKGDRTRFTSDVLSFNEMSEHFNQNLSISGKIPLGHFNSSFGFSGSWQKDASNVKKLAFDGVFISLYSVQLSRSQLTLKEDVRASLPSSWDPAALANFIEKYGTHVIVGVTIGGKDVVYLRQSQSSSSSTVKIQKILEGKANERFSSVKSSVSAEKITGKERDRHPWMKELTMDQFMIDGDDVMVYFKRKGGQESLTSHNEWLQTVPLSPDILSMNFIPITSLLNGVTGTGFLSHAINLYLRYKPPIEDLRVFLEFQLPKEWAPAFGDLPLGPPRKQLGNPSLQFRMLGPKLQVNTTPVMTGTRPVTGMRLHLEGLKGNKLAIHLQYLTVIPQILLPVQQEDRVFTEEEWVHPGEGFNRYFEPVMWKSFSHVCTAPVENGEAWGSEQKGTTIVTGAQLYVEEHCSRKILFLRLHYSKIPKARVRKSEWDHSPASQQKSGIFSTLLSSSFSIQQAPTPKPVQVNSAVYPDGPPPNKSQTPKLLKFVDTSEMTRGPLDQPGHWLVTGAKLNVENGKIGVRLQYSLLIYNIE